MLMGVEAWSAAVRLWIDEEKAAPNMDKTGGTGDKQGKLKKTNDVSKNRE